MATYKPVSRFAPKFSGWECRLSALYRPCFCGIAALINQAAPESLVRHRANERFIFGAPKLMQAGVVSCGFEMTTKITLIPFPGKISKQGL